MVLERKRDPGCPSCAAAQLYNLSNGADGVPLNSRVTVHHEDVGECVVCNDNGARWVALSAEVTIRIDVDKAVALMAGRPAEVRAAALLQALEELGCMALLPKIERAKRVWESP